MIFSIDFVTLFSPKPLDNSSSAFNAHALGALAEVAGPGLDFHLGTVLPALLSAMGDDDDVVCYLSMLVILYH